MRIVASVAIVGAIWATSALAQDPQAAAPAAPAAPATAPAADDLAKMTAEQLAKVIDERKLAVDLIVEKASIEEVKHPSDKKGVGYVIDHASGLCFFTMGAAPVVVDCAMVDKAKALVSDLSKARQNLADAQAAGKKAGVVKKDDKKAKKKDKK